MEPFKVKKIKTNLLRKILGLDSVDEFITTVNNLLANAKGPYYVHKEDIQELKKIYKITGIKEKIAKGKLKEIFIEYLQYLLEIDSFSMELGGVQHMMNILDISINKPVAENLIKEYIKKKIARGSYNESFKENYIDFAKTFLDDKQEILIKAISAMIDNNLTLEILGTDMSKSNKTLFRIIDEFDLEGILDFEVLEKLEKLQLIYSIRNDKLRPVEVNINLKRGEVCYLETPAALFATARDALLAIDRGNIYITNKRFIFKGYDKSISLNWNRILTVDIIGWNIDGEKIKILRIFKSSGKPIDIEPLLLEPEILKLLIEKLLKMDS